MNFTKLTPNSGMFSVANFLDHTRKLKKYKKSERFPFGKKKTEGYVYEIFVQMSRPTLRCSMVAPDNLFFIFLTSVDSVVLML